MNFPLRCHVFLSLVFYTEVDTKHGPCMVDFFANFKLNLHDTHDNFNIYKAGMLSI